VPSAGTVVVVRDSPVATYAADRAWLRAACRRRSGGSSSVRTGAAGRHR
jgi:hypothetical protein